MQLDGNNLSVTVDEIKEKIPVHYLDVIRERADAVDKTAETILFTEDLRE